jgi:hypothetical protein
VKTLSSKQQRYFERKAAKAPKQQIVPFFKIAAVPYNDQQRMDYLEELADELSGLCLDWQATVTADWDARAWRDPDQPKDFRDREVAEICEDALHDAVFPLGHWVVDIQCGEQLKHFDWSGKSAAKMKADLLAALEKLRVEEVEPLIGWDQTCAPNFYLDKRVYTTPPPTFDEQFPIRKRKVGRPAKNGKGARSNTERSRDRRAAIKKAKEAAAKGFAKC